MGSKRKDIIEATCELLEKQGYHATGLNQIVAESGAPKGSLYYYFPEGKEELTAEAIERMGRRVAERIRDRLATIDDPAAAIQSFVLDLGEHVEASGFHGGSPITIVALEAPAMSARLNAACRDAYQLWQQVFRDKLTRSGYDADEAGRLATLIVASIEGAIVLSRTSRSVEPLRHTAQEIGARLEHLAQDRAS